ncbi:type IV pilin-like G/H family protein [Cyanobacterium aponinum AL20118]|uniref:Type IV pilin-like G/H family protein n=1 Tax=Cyanobacterium aponinum AL20115 TaxID=3090662 RepID=A0AAF0ZGZ9_9CHRO|nr:type IV pilin-like G/H family protein [Cyanobacterium aponinum]WPF90080.1 type IV pilin-like G/H family protein [Cyanobacterium aponinum AL20115]
MMCRNKKEKQKLWKNLNFYHGVFFSHQGFTLIELMVVMIIAGILASIAIPTFVNQTGKAREAEVKNTLGNINRSQLAFHWEQRRFCCGGYTSSEILDALGIKVDQIYVSGYDIIPVTDNVTIEAVNNNPLEFGLRAYASSVYFDPISADYSIYLCRSINVQAQTTAPTNTGTCAADAERIN